MRAKYACTHVTDYPGQEEAHLRAVYADGAEENNAFNQATPDGELRIMIDNPAAFGFFVPGDEYYLDITPCQPSAGEGG